MAEAISAASPVSTTSITTAQQARLAQLKAASPTLHLNQPAPPKRRSSQISPPAGTVTLRVVKVMAAEDYCTEVLNWLQAVVNWINPILSWFQNVLPWLNGIAWFLSLIGVGAWLSAVISWLESWITDLQGWIADIQDVINWARQNGCGASWVQDFINEVEQLEQDLVGAYNWLVSAINWIEGLF
jgi:hypothetical protein